MVVLAIVGSRYFTDYTFFCERLEHYIGKYGKPTEIVSGAAKGADELAKHYAEEHEIPYRDFPADWKRYGLKAGPMRNNLIVDAAEEMIAFPLSGSKGTWDSIGKAKAKGIPVHVYRRKTNVVK